MIVAFVSMLTTFLLCAFFHYEVLTGMSRFIPGEGRVVRPIFLLIMAIVVVAHFAEIVLFAMTFYLLQETWDIGHIDGEFTGIFFDYVYFSAVTYTSLGLGDVWPHGPLRLVTSIEALTGLILIGWTVWFSYPIVRRGCRQGHRGGV
ncbi:potassium channel family protein [Thalassospiraceae bacterium LMO-JJ14]|nr:potassium channel family protein [Thalassospiraceae bacterium LMO-JJ14]